MFATFRRVVPAIGLGLALAVQPASAQDNSPLSLDEALARAGISSASTASADNPRITAPAARSEAARAEIEQARLSPNPELGVEVENIAGTGPFSGLQSVEYTLSLSQRIELGGKRDARISAAKAGADLADVEESMAQADLALAVRERYVTAVAASARVELARDIVRRNVELARVAEKLVEVGREPPLRAMRARSELAEAEADLQAAEAESVAMRAALAALWGSDTRPVVADDFPRIARPAPTAEGASPLALRAAGSRTRAAEAEAERARALASPDPTLTAGVRRYEGRDEQAFLVGLSIPLPFRNRNQGNIAAARARANAAAADEAVARADYRQELIEAEADYRAAEARVETLEASSLPQAEEALRLAEIGYRNGKFALVELLDAAEARDNVRRSLIAAKEQRGRAAARLLRLAAQ